MIHRKRSLMRHIDMPFGRLGTSNRWGLQLPVGLKGGREEGSVDVDRVEESASSCQREGGLAGQGLLLTQLIP